MRTTLTALVFLVVWVTSGQAPDAREPTEADWRCSEAQLDALRKLGRDEARSLSNKAAKVEWRRSAAVRQRVGRGLRYYQEMRWLYIGRGICDVEVFLSDGVVASRFLGHRTLVLREVGRRLALVEQRLSEKPRFYGIGSLQVRTIRGPFKPIDRLSKHALGRALDIEAARNPFLSNKTIALLEEIGGVELKLSARHPVGERWDSVKAAAEAFRKNVRGWIKDQHKRRAALLGRARRGDTQARREARALDAHVREVRRNAHLRLIQRRRFLSLPRDFVVEMEAAGLTWCTDFPSGADLMHFEWRR